MRFDLSDVLDDETIVVTPMQVAEILRPSEPSLVAHDWFRWAPLDGMIAGQRAVRVWWVGRCADGADYVHRSDILLSSMAGAPRVFCGDVADIETVHTLLGAVDHAVHVTGAHRRQASSGELDRAIDQYESHLVAVRLMAASQDGWAF